MKEINYNFFEVIKHVFTHKSLVNFGYKLIIIRLIYAIIYPFILCYKVFKYLFTYQKNEK
ncbi:hypothetical protein AYP1020_p29 (plasmid) [Staphylococcus capitis subsp. capitis]|nr:hypothetical protein AYP1020_p29 [Staphylococcus capitis subsp. capitis]